jgi:hypothetical protein
VRYRKPSTEVEAVQWTGTNIDELWDRFGAENIYGPTETNGHPVITENGCNVLEGVPLERVGDWIIGNRHESGWSLARLTDGQFQALGYKPAYRDRNENYVPDGLHLDGPVQHVEISEARQGRSAAELEVYMATAGKIIQGLLDILDGGDGGAAPGGDIVYGAKRWLDTMEKPAEWQVAKPPRTARLAMASPDEHNRDQAHWWWVDVSGDGTHWSRFDGHRVQVDVELRTSNNREVNDWKGRDEVRAGGEWQISLNRQPVYSGWVGTDVGAALRHIDRKLAKLLDGYRVGLDHQSDVPYAEQLMGARIYYGTTPAVVTHTILDQGCVMIEPVGLQAFPRDAYELDDEPDGTGHGEQDLYDEYENRRLKVHIDSPHIWWGRRRPYAADEPDKRYRPKRERAVAVEVTEDTEQVEQTGEQGS